MKKRIHDDDDDNNNEKLVKTVERKDGKSVHYHIDTEHVVHVTYMQTKSIDVMHKADIKCRNPALRH